MAQALPVEIQAPAGRVLAVTLDLSTGGFSTIVSEAPELGTRIGFRLRLGRGLRAGHGLGQGRERGAPERQRPRSGVAFDEMASADRERLEFVIVDAVLKQFGALGRNRGWTKVPADVCKRSRPPCCSISTAPWSIPSP